MTDLKTSLFFTGFSITTPCILAYLASISYNMTWADAILIMGLTVIDLIVMMIGGFGVIDHTSTKHIEKPKKQGDNGVT